MRRIALFLTVTLVCACGLRPPPRPPEIPSAVARLTLIGQYSIGPGQRVPSVTGLPFGGISGLAARNGGTDLWGVSDAQRGGRIYRFAVEGLGGEMKVTPSQVVFLDGVPQRDRADDESMALLADGTIVVCSEGSNTEPRLPPALTQYGRHGDFIRTLPLRDRYVPEPTGPVTKGARGNTGFESITLSPDGERLFTAVETALVQDGDPATFDAGTLTRLLEYVPHEGSFEPAREFAYQLEPLQKPSFTPGVYINGLADVLALDRSTLITLERAFVQESGAQGRGMNTIRLYRVSLAAATDVSKLDSLKGQTGVVPVTKTLLLDLGQVQGLSRELGPALDNFEGLAFGPRLPDGRATLLMVSDDNFSETQRTWFLAFAIE